MRIEKDILGEIPIEDSVYYGISTYRSIHNFSVTEEVTNYEIIKELINIKKQAIITNYQLGYIEEKKYQAILDACDILLSGKHRDAFVTPRHQGGAGTSSNMNVNEVIANLALQQLEMPLGSYNYIHPINDINLHQSTNDVYPTAVKIAAIKGIRKLASNYAALQQIAQEKEKEFDSILKLGRTQMMDALPLRVGQSFGAYAEVFSRDRWRIYKAEERLRVINIGGTAIGTGCNAPLKYTFMMTKALQESTNIGLSRAENLVDNTQNIDVFAEVSGLLKVASLSLIKISNDLRFLSSGPHGGINELILEKHQVGSSIMPGKVNPVILEMTIMNAYKVIANDSLISNLVASGNLELNAFIPGIAEALLESIEMLSNTIELFGEKCLRTIQVNKEKCLKNVEHSPALITPLISIIGYDKASEIVRLASKKGVSIKDVLVEENILTKKEVDELLSPLNVTKPGILERSTHE